MCIQRSGDGNGRIRVVMVDDIGLVSTEGVVQSLYVLGHVQTIIDVVAEGDAIYTALPKEVRRQLEHQGCTPDVTVETKAKAALAFAFAQQPREVRDSVRQMMEEVKLFVAEDAMSGELDANDLAVIQEMIGFVQRAGSRSVRQLLNFLKAQAEGEHGALLLEGRGGKGVEMVARTRLSPETRSEFGLN